MVTNKWSSMIYEFITVKEETFIPNGFPISKSESCQHRRFACWPCSTMGQSSFVSTLLLLILLLSRSGTRCALFILERMLAVVVAAVDVTPLLELFWSKFSTFAFISF